MAIDNTSSPVVSIESGTGWSVDVTDCNLDADLTLKDFKVLFDGVVQVNTNFTKTSRTSIQYGGSSIGSTEVTFYRDTPITRIQEVVYKAKLTSDLWESEFNRLHKVAVDANLNLLSDEAFITTSPIKSGLIKIAVDATNEISTISGNLVLDSASGTTQIDDILSVTGNASVGGTLTSTGNLTVSTLTSGRMPYITTSGLITDTAGFTFDGTDLTTPSLIVSDLTATRIPYAGASGAIVDNSAFTFDGTDLTIPSIVVSDLTTTRIPYAGASGALQDSANLTFDGSDITVSSAIVSDLTSGRVTYAGSGGSLVDSGNLTFDGNNLTVTAIDSSETISTNSNDTTVPTTAWVKDIYDIRSVVGGRITIATDDPLLGLYSKNVTTINSNSGTLNSSTVYYVPFTSDKIALYNTGASEWQIYTIPSLSSPISASVASIASAETIDLPVDVYIYPDGSNCAIELVAWTDYGNRATTIAFQDGIPVKTGDASRRYVGVIAVTGGATTLETGATGYAVNAVNFARQIKANDSSTQSGVVRCNISNFYNTILESFCFLGNGGSTNSWGTSGTSAGTITTTIDNMRIQFPTHRDTNDFIAQWSATDNYYTKYDRNNVVSSKSTLTVLVNDWNSQTDVEATVNQSICDDGSNPTSSYSFVASGSPQATKYNQTNDDTLIVSHAVNFGTSIYPTSYISFAPIMRRITGSTASISCLGAFSTNEVLRWW